MSNLKCMLKKVCGGINKRKFAKVICLVGLASGAYLFYDKATIVKIGSNSTHYTYADVNRYYNFANKVADLTGGQAIRNRSVAFEMLTVAAMQKEILEAKKVVINKDRAIELVEAQSVVSGLLKSQRKEMGDDDYYHVVVQPAAVSQLFVSYYRANDPAGKVARAALDAGQQSGIVAAAQKAGQKVVAVKVPIVPANSAFIEEAKQNVNAIIPKVVEDESGYSVVYVREVNEREIVADVVSIPRKPFGSFLRDELKTLNIPYSNSFYSWFRVSSFEKTGAIFAETTKNSSEASN